MWQASHRVGSKGRGGGEVRVTEYANPKSACIDLRQGVSVLKCHCWNRPGDAVRGEKRQPDWDAVSFSSFLFPCWGWFLLAVAWGWRSPSLVPPHVLGVSDGLMLRGAAGTKARAAG